MNQVDPKQPKAETTEPPLKVYTVDTSHMQSVKNSFTYHAPKPDQIPRYEHLRSEALKLAEHIMAFVPPSRERSLAITKLEESIMWANKGIACNERE